MLALISCHNSAIYPSVFSHFIGYLPVAIGDIATTLELQVRWQGFGEALFLLDTFGTLQGTSIKGK